MSTGVAGLWCPEGVGHPQTEGSHRHPSPGPCGPEGLFF